MKFSVQWLKQWVDLDIDALELADRLTAGGLEVDSVEPVAAGFSGVVVGRIDSVRPHPDADKLSVCQVDAGDGDLLQVVCGAPNAREGLLMPFARVGAELAGGFGISKTGVRGVDSHGMCCSARELGLSDDHSGLLELPGDAIPGTDFRDYLGLDDYTIDLDLTPNRADCLGIRGLSRDVSAICDAAYTPVDIPEVEAVIDDVFPVRLDDGAGCPAYAGRIIRNVNPAARTPMWMVEALRRSGVRSISAVVDISNYVMLELGQPMHAFDLDRLDGEIHVRRGLDGESLVLLDEKEITLDPSLLAICDASGPVAIAGIMGGLSTGVTDTTTHIFLESAWFEPAVISGRARKLGLHTDASHRFERGVDPGSQAEAIERMTALLIEITGGEPGPVVLARSGDPMPVNGQVSLRKARLDRVLGCKLDEDEVSRIFTRLGMDWRYDNGAWQVTAPGARFDIAIEEDLVEEVARIHGYDAIPGQSPGGELSLQGMSEREIPMNRVRDAMCAGGYQEAINYSFIDPALLESLGMPGDEIYLSNPISADMAAMRTSLLPGLLTSLRRNIRRQQNRVRLFETGTVFFFGREEAERIGAVACGDALPEQWGTHRRPLDFYDFKRDIETLLALRGTDRYHFEPAAVNWLHPGQSATITIGDQAAGWAGVLHPGKMAELDIRVPVLAFELDLRLLLIREIPYAKNISRFPSVRRDLAFLMPESVKYDEVKDCVKNIAGELLKDLLIFDVFSGQNVEKGYKSLAIGLILQDVSCTLTDEVVDSTINRVIRALESGLEAQHRG